MIVIFLRYSDIFLFFMNRRRIFQHLFTFDRWYVKQVKGLSVNRVLHHNTFYFSSDYVSSSIYKCIKYTIYIWNIYIKIFNSLLSNTYVLNIYKSWYYNICLVFEELKNYLPRTFLRPSSIEFIFLQR